MRPYLPPVGHAHHRKYSYELPVRGPPASIMGSELPRTGLRPFAQIETFVTLCGMVWVRAKVLGQMGWTTSPYLRAGALSCPSLAIYGLGSCGAPAFSRSAPPRCHCVSYVYKGNRVVYIRNPMSHRGPDRGPPASIGVGRCCLACLAEVLVSKSACQPVSPLCL